MASSQFHYAAKAWAEATHPGCAVISTNRHNRTISGFWPIDGNPRHRVGKALPVPAHVS